MGRAVGDAQHRLRRGMHLQQGAVFAHQHIAAPHHGAAWQKHADGTALGVGSLKAAFLAHIPIQREAGAAFEQDRGQATATSDEFGKRDHQNKK